MTVRRTLIGALLALGLLALLALLHPGQRERVYASEQFLMDTLVSIKAYGGDEEALRRAVTAAYAEMRRLAELADGFPEPGSAAARRSDVCRVNAAAGREPVRVDPDIMAMLVLARHYAELSGGAFDVTVGPFMQLWGFGGESPRVPEAQPLRAALGLVGSRDLELNQGAGTAFLRRPGMRLDLGAIAKGYATEKALRVLKNNGVTKALIDAGGNIRVLGEKDHGVPWKIGIKDPRKAEAVVAVLRLRDSSAVTSGDYYRGFEAGGKRYHHILDPRTGYPAGHTMSATVVTGDAGLADLLSTVCFVLPPEKALEFAARLGGVELFLVDAGGRIRHTPGLSGRIEVQPGGYRYDQGR